VTLPADLEAGDAAETEPPGAPTEPGRAVRSRRRLREIALVTVLAVAVCTLMYRHVLRTLSTAVPTDPTWDPLYFAWQLAWVGHAVVTDPGSLWTTNAFLREPGNLAFTDTVLGYLPLTLLVGTDGMAEAIRGLNLALVAANVIAFLGAYALARVLGARVAGALVAGAGFAFAPWRIQQIDHINVLSTGGMALTLALLCLGHGWSLRAGWRPERIRAGWIWAAWLVACWQLTFGFALGVVFGYVLAAVMLLWLLGWVIRRRARLPVRLLVAHAGGGAIFLGFTAALARPYLHALAAHPEATRTEAYLGLFSPRWLGFFTAPEHHAWYSPYQETWRSHLGWTNETLLLPGYLLMALAVAGLFCSSWPLRRRLALGLVTFAVALLAMGTAAPAGGELTFLPLWRHLPGWDSMRTPGRLVIWVTLGLCLLAAGAVSRLADRFAPSGGRPAGPVRLPSASAAAAALLLALPAVLVTGEGIGRTPPRVVTAAPWDMRALQGPVLVIPSQPLVDYQIMLWSVDGWPVMANGSSGFDPTWLEEFRATQKGFPDAYSVHDIQARGIKTVVVLKGWVSEAQKAALERKVDDLGITKIYDGEVAIYRIP
jgi:hypothetical protein